MSFSKTLEGKGVKRVGFRVLGLGCPEASQDTARGCLLQATLIRLEQSHTESIPRDVEKPEKCRFWPGLFIVCCIFAGAWSSSQPRTVWVLSKPFFEDLQKGMVSSGLVAPHSLTHMLVK